MTATLDELERRQAFTGLLATPVVSAHAQPGLWRWFAVTGPRSLSGSVTASAIGVSSPRPVRACIVRRSIPAWSLPPGRGQGLAASWCSRCWLRPPPRMLKT
jgi:hypothetical protein